MTPRPQPVLPEQGRRARSIFEAVMQRRPSERMAFIDGACLGDEAVRAQVLYLLDTSEAPVSQAQQAPPFVPPMPAAAPPVVVSSNRAVEATSPAPAPAENFDKTRIAAPPASTAPVAAPAIEDYEKTRVAPSPGPGSAPIDDQRTLVATPPAPAPASIPAGPMTSAASTVAYTGMQSSIGAMPPTRPFDPNQPMEGRRVGPYQLLYSLGQGGMGSVYAASRADEEYKKVVAIKLVTTGLQSREMLRRFRNERQVLAGLDHPSIARLIDGGTTEDGIPYLVMEFVEGLPIDRYCQSQRLSLRERLQLFGKVCSAVQYAHEHLVIHRDIKPGNIVVSGTGEPKLLDFGIARLMTAESSAVEAELSKGEAQPMTLRYASPEQVKGEPISTSSDIYALGVLLYELITGRHPFQNALGGRTEIENAILHQQPQKPSVVVREKLEGKLAEKAPPEPPLRLSRHLQGDLDCIVLHALEKTPQARYSSVQSFWEDINNYLEALPVNVRKDDFKYRATKFVQRHIPGVIAAGIIATIMAGATVVSVRSEKSAQVERAKAVARFNDVHKLAHSVMYELDDAIRSGQTPARKFVVSLALGYLKSLAADAGQDMSLEQQKEIVDGYLKVGDLQGNPLLQNLGDIKGARESYNQALAILKKVQASHRGDTEVAVMNAEITKRFADLLINSDHTGALKLYQEAQAELKPLAINDANAKHVLIHVLDQIGFLENLRGDHAAALSAYSQGEELARVLFAANRNDIPARQSMAFDETRIGEQLIQMSRREEALQHLRNALAIQDEMVALNPTNDSQHQKALILATMGDAFQSVKDIRNAISSYRNAVELYKRLAANDPNNKQYRTNLPLVEDRLANALIEDKQMEEAHRLTEEELQFLRPIVDQGTPYLETYQFCYTLLTTPFQDLRNPALAKPYVEKLVQSNPNDFGVLDLLAMAYFGLGDRERAIAMENKAIAALPPGPSESRSALEANLAKFQGKKP